MGTDLPTGPSCANMPPPNLIFTFPNPHHLSLHHCPPQKVYQNANQSKKALILCYHVNLPFILQSKMQMCQSSDI